MKNLLFVFIGILVLFTSCSEKEQTHDQKTRKIVETYIDNLLKDESIMEYKIESLVINNITEKQDLEKEAFRYRDLALDKKDEAKKLTKDFGGIRNIASLGDVDISEQRERYEQKIKEISKEALKYSELAKGLASQSLKADSTKVLYYDVVARGTITSLRNVQKNAIFPFHISKDYKILKDPIELRREQLKSNKG